MREQRTLFDLTQDGLVIGKKIQRIYPESDAEQTILTYYAVAYKRPTGRITRKRYRLSQRKLQPKQRVAYEKSLFLLPSLKQYDDGKACFGWHRFELEVNGDVLGSFDFEVTAPKDQRTV